ncbi:MAG: HAMP domain-containing sensor histidine kinase [Myxococcota bacterium]
MNARAPLVQRSVNVLLAFCATALLAGLVLWDPSRIATSAGFVGLFTAAAFLARGGHTRAAAWLVLGFGALSLYALIATSGFQSHFVQYLPLLCAAAWAWLGRRAGVAVAITSSVVMASTWFEPRAMESDEQVLTAHVFAAVALVSFAISVTRDLRQVVDLAAKRAEDAEAAATRARASDASRTRFVAAATHELQAPLDLVLHNTAVLRANSGDEWSRDLQNIERAALQLRGLIDDVLDIGRADAPDFPLTLEPAELGALVRDVAEMSAGWVAGRGNHLELALGAPVVVHTDKARTRQILTNLLSNASKYTQDGRITVAVEATGDVARISVTDTGVGVPQDKVGLLFQPFVQLHSGTERRPGVGLGLALSRRLAERLGGTITMTPAEGAGSVFTLTLPRGPATPPG